MPDGCDQTGVDSFAVPGTMAGMKITLNEDERYYLTSALKHAIRRVDKHAEKVYDLPDGGGAYELTTRDANWLRNLLALVERKPAKAKRR